MSFKDPEKERQYQREYGRRWRAANKQRVRAYQAKYRANNPEKVLLRSKRNNWKRDGLNPAEVEAALARHNNGHCEICGDKEPGRNRSWHVDHNHATGKLRGILCGNCNRGLGYFKDDARVLEAAVRYLKARN